MKVWRTIFAVAAIYNLAVGGAMIAAPERIADQLEVSGEGGLYLTVMAGILIAVFGIGYALVAAAPAKHRGIVWIGMIGKAGVVLLTGARVFLDGVVMPAQQIALPMGDLVFVALFARFLWRGPR